MKETLLGDNNVREEVKSRNDPIERSLTHHGGWKIKEMFEGSVTVNRLKHDMDKDEE